MTNDEPGSPQPRDADAAEALLRLIVALDQGSASDVQGAAERMEALVPGAAHKLGNLMRLRRLRADDGPLH